MKNNDRLKFRIWAKRTEEYITEFLGNNIMLSHEGEIYAMADDYTGNRNIYDLNERNDFAVEQCTGLKDKNGKIIYEGDIVSYNLREGFVEEKFNPKYTVFWNDMCMRFDLLREGKIENIYLEPFFNNKLEIVGNIHERKIQNVKPEYPPSDIRNFILSE